MEEDGASEGVRSAAAAARGGGGGETESEPGIVTKMVHAAFFHPLDVRLLCNGCPKLTWHRGPTTIRFSTRLPRGERRHPASVGSGGSAIVMPWEIRGFRVALAMHRSCGKWRDPARDYCWRNVQ